MQDDRTSHLDLPLPFVDNDLTEDVARLRAALEALDTFAANGTIEAARRLATARKINDVDFDGTADITITAEADGGAADTAARLQTGRLINGVTFDGSANITITAEADGGDAETAEQLKTARKINGVDFDGTADITIEVSDDTKLPLEGGTITGEEDATSTATGALRVSGGAGVAKSLHVGGEVVASGDLTAFSDERLKEDIQAIAGALEKTRKLRGVTFTDKATGERRTGVIAQELQKVLPEAVRQNGEYLAVAYGNVVGLLIEAVKELSGKVDALTPRKSARSRS